MYKAVTVGGILHINVFEVEQEFNILNVKMLSVYSVHIKKC